MSGPQTNKLTLSRLTEGTESSTWRQLEVIRYSLDSVKNLLKNKHVKWHTDNYTRSIVAKSGNNKRELEGLAVEIFNITFTHNIRKNIELADKFSKTIDYDHWYVTPDLFKMVTVRRWGAATIDRFASEKNRKTMKFSSKHLCPGRLGIDAFAVDWIGAFNWYVLPVYLIGKTIKHFCS